MSRRAAVARVVPLSVALVAATGAAALAGHPASRTTEEAPALAPDTVLRRYAAALAALEKPKAISFDYMVEQVGARNLVQTHRVYRSGTRERDETKSVDGYTLRHPAIRILTKRVDRYDVSALAPRPGAYAMRYVGIARAYGTRTYGFKSVARSAVSFAVSEVAIDAKTFLPAALRFDVSGHGARGWGELRFGAAERFWLVLQARVRAQFSDGRPARERIVWSNYQFPASLPPSTFLVPHPLTPSAVPTPAPDSLLDTDAGAGTDETPP